MAASTVVFSLMDKVMKLERSLLAGCTLGLSGRKKKKEAGTFFAPIVSLVTAGNTRRGELLAFGVVCFFMASSY